MIENFLRFPLALLAYEPGDALATLEAIKGYVAVGLGLDAAERQKDRDIFDVAVACGVEEFDRADPEDDYECAALIGFNILGLTGCHPKHTVQCFSRAAGFLHGRDESSRANTATISMDFYWSALETARGTPQERTLSFREFRVLCALLSKIGVSGCAKCGWQEIQARAAGWCGKVAMRDATGPEKERRLPLILSRQQIRATLARLESDYFFARFQYHRGESWFSFSCGRDRGQLATRVLQRKTRRTEALRAWRETDAQRSTTSQPPHNHLPNQAANHH